MSRFLDLAWPDHCVLCRMPLKPRLAHLLCPHCWPELPWLKYTCRHCALPQSEPGVCGACQQQPLVPGIAVIPLLHTEEAQYLVHRFKFQRGMREGKTLSQAMLCALAQAYLFQTGSSTTLPQALLPIPLSVRKKIRRGYNQSSILAEVLAKSLHLPVLYPFRRRHGPSQQNLSKTERQRLSPGVFHHAKEIDLRHVAIVDDVLTTGSTVRAFKQALTRQGVQQIDVWCATRAIATVGHDHALRTSKS